MSVREKIQFILLSHHCRFLLLSQTSGMVVRPLMLKLLTSPKMPTLLNGVLEMVLPDWLLQILRILSFILI